MSDKLISTKRELLHKYINSIEEKKVDAMYIIFEDVIENEMHEFSDEYKAEFDQRYKDYLADGKLVSQQEANSQIETLINSFIK